MSLRSDLRPVITRLENEALRLGAGPGARARREHEQLVREAVGSAKTITEAFENSRRLWSEIGAEADKLRQAMALDFFVRLLPLAGLAIGFGLTSVVRTMMGPDLAVAGWIVTALAMGYGVWVYLPLRRLMRLLVVRWTFWGVQGYVKRLQVIAAQLERAAEVEEQNDRLSAELRDIRDDLESG